MRTFAAPARRKSASHARAASAGSAEAVVRRDDDPPHPFIPRRHDASETHVAPGERLELERNVLDDVRPVRSLAHSIDEAVTGSAAARLLAQRWECREEPSTESRTLYDKREGKSHTDTRVTSR